MRGAGWGSVNFKEILRRSKGVCYICDRVVSPGGFEFDHVIPFARGGAHAESNIRVACRSCNRRKNRKMLDEFVCFLPERPSDAEAA
jgi:5-methylcytosine-specific restriction endonuclease McrA